MLLVLLVWQTIRYIKRVEDKRNKIRIYIQILAIFTSVNIIIHYGFLSPEQGQKILFTNYSMKTALILHLGTYFINKASKVLETGKRK